MPWEPRKFRNHYRCPRDGSGWEDTWSCMCNDRCPVCNAEIEPYASEELCLECDAVSTVRKTASAWTAASPSETSMSYRRRSPAEPSALAKYGSST